MTKQIVIKLNERRFRPIIDSLKEFCGPIKSDSELAGKALFCMHSIMFDKVHSLDNMTIFEFLAGERGLTIGEAHFDFLKRYDCFLQKGSK